MQRMIAKVLPFVGPSAEGLYGQRMAGKSLSQIAAVKSDELELFVGFDALADDANPQAMRHGDDRLNRCVPRVATLKINDLSILTVSTGRCFR